MGFGLGSNDYIMKIHQYLKNLLLGIKPMSKVYSHMYIEVECLFENCEFYYPKVRGSDVRAGL